MATSIASVACHDAGIETASIVLLWIAVMAYAALVAADLIAMRNPMRLIRRAGELDHGIDALGFVAATCVLGTRIAVTGSLGRAISTGLLACAGVAWFTIGAIIALRHEGAHVERARGGWLLAVVATEGLAILTAMVGTFHHAAALRTIAVVLWLFGGVLYVVIGEALAVRLSRRRLRPIEFTPDWWIVMGAAAIFTLGATVAGHAHTGSPAGALGLAA
jgi:hypothetical protein